MSKKKYDAIVVGSGATGGFAAKELTERGFEVLLLEAGPAVDESAFDKVGGFSGVGSIARILEALKGKPIQARATWFSPEKSFLFVNDRKNPYTFPREHFYLWIRGRQVGGRFLSWGRVAIRMSDYDFKAASRDGVGEDWPICYDDLAPYYDQVEEFLKLVGTRDGIPNLPDGKYVAEAGLSGVERRFKQTVESTWPDRKVVPWRYVSKQATPVDPETGKRITAPIAAAMKTGRLTLRPDSVVSRIDIDPATGKATGVSFIDRNTRQAHAAAASVVVVCASTIESVRLLLNSACERHPDGVGNSSGLLGRYFMDQCPTLAFGTIPGSDGWELVDGTSADDNHGGIYIPRFQNLDQVTHPQFKRGFNIQGMAGRGHVPEGAPALFGIGGQGEMLPYYDHRISIDPRRKDAWGIPAAHVEIALTDNERHLLRCELDTVREMIDACGWDAALAISQLGIDNDDKLLPQANWIERFLFRRSFRKSIGLGAAIHECGGARMGDDPAKSILNPYNQCWDATNVFVTDSSCFVSNGTCGPTLTTMALTVRTCEYIAKQYGSSPELHP